jgi:hypothetical protein
MVMTSPHAAALAAVFITALAAQTAAAQVIYYAPPSAGVAGAVAPLFVPPPAPPAPVAAAPVVFVPVVAAPAQPAGLTVRSYYRVKTGGRMQTVAKRMNVAYNDLVHLNPGLDATGVLPAGTMVALPIP